MSTFQVAVTRINQVLHHPNADRLDIAKVGDYNCIVGKGTYSDEDLVAYIPEAAIVPPSILEELGLTGRLAGSKRDRVKAIRLRGIVSQGLVYPAREGWVEGQDVADELGIYKWEPPVPAQLAGQVFAAPGLTMRYDIENIKRWPDVLQEGETVVMTEKIHGTWTCVGLLPVGSETKFSGNIIVGSKGLSAKGLAMKLQDAEGSLVNEGNLYVRVAKRLIESCGDTLMDMTSAYPLYILGETFGKGMQDLAYGHNVGQDDRIGFRVFDVYLGWPGKGTYLDDDALTAFCMALGLSRVPVLYVGPYSTEKMLELTSGKETVTGQEQHIREGIVINPTQERRHPQLGRVKLKSVSADYLLRKGNTTEYA